MKPKLRTGLSLIELVVALAIIGSVAAMAVRSMNGLQQQTKYNSGTKLLTDIQAAVLGQSGSPPSGFVADVGRLPKSVAGGLTVFGQTDWAGELTAQNGIGAYSLVAAPLDPTVKIGTGWQGPYLQLGIGKTAVLDGWGTPLQVRDSGGAVIAAAGTPIYEYRSLGNDRLADPPVGTGATNAYNKDTALTIPSAVTAAGWQATITGSVLVYDLSIPGLVSPAGTVTVYYFGPDGNGGVAQLTDKAHAGNGWTYTFTGVPIGPRVLKAYYDGNTDAAGANPAILPSAATKVSPALAVTLRAGAQTAPTLILPK